MGAASLLLQSLGDLRLLAGDQTWNGKFVWIMGLMSVFVVHYVTVNVSSRFGVYKNLKPDKQARWAQDTVCMVYSATLGVLYGYAV